MQDLQGSVAVLTRLLGEVEALLKEVSVGHELARRGVNTSIALVATQGLAAYIEGNWRRASDDLSTAAEEIEARRSRG
jgi:hypothetical protein